MAWCRQATSYYLNQCWLMSEDRHMLTWLADLISNGFNKRNDIAWNISLRTYSAFTMPYDDCTIYIYNNFTARFRYFLSINVCENYLNIYFIGMWSFNVIFYIRNWYIFNMIFLSRDYFLGNDEKTSVFNQFLKGITWTELVVFQNVQFLRILNISNCYFEFWNCVQLPTSEVSLHQGMYTRAFCSVTPISWLDLLSIDEDCNIWHWLFMPVLHNSPQSCLYKRFREIIHYPIELTRRVHRSVP